MPREHPINSFLYDFMCRGLEPTRKRVLAGVRGRVLEIGAGTGLNFPIYPADVSVVAFEPDADMLRRALPRRRSARARVSLMAAFGEALPFRDASFDTIVSTLVFCTIADPHSAARELRRVLKPGGRFHFLEHVRASTRWLASMQDGIEPVWPWFFGGCHVNRDTASIFRAAGFDLGAIEISKRGAFLSGVATAS